MVAIPPRVPDRPPSPIPWRPSLQIFVIQLVVMAVGVALMLLTPLGLAPLLGWSVGAMLFGAWAWAIRIGKPAGMLERPLLRVIARRTALLGGATVGVAYAGIALVPGQLTLPWFMVFVVAAMLAAGGGFASLVLTLCGIDAARGGEDPTSPPA